MILQIVVVFAQFRVSLGYGHVLLFVTIETGERSFDVPFLHDVNLYIYYCRDVNDRYAIYVYTYSAIEHSIRCSCLETINH